MLNVMCALTLSPPLRLRVSPVRLREQLPRHRQCGKFGTGPSCDANHRHGRVQHSTSTGRGYTAVRPSRDSYTALDSNRTTQATYPISMTELFDSSAFARATAPAAPISVYCKLRCKPQARKSSPRQLAEVAQQSVRGVSLTTHQTALAPRRQRTQWW
jgi:hypothetical protein